LYKFLYCAGAIGPSTPSRATRSAVEICSTPNRQASDPAVASARIQVAALDALTAGPSQSASWAVLGHNVGFVPSDDNVHGEGRKIFRFRVSTC